MLVCNSIFIQFNNFINKFVFIVYNIKRNKIPNKCINNSQLSEVIPHKIFDNLFS